MSVGATASRLAGWAFKCSTAVCDGASAQNDFRELLNVTNRRCGFLQTSTFSASSNSKPFGRYSRNFFGFIVFDFGVCRNEPRSGLTWGSREAGNRIVVGFLNEYKASLRCSFYAAEYVTCCFPAMRTTLSRRLARSLD